MSGLVLDTNAFLWLLADSGRLGPAARRRLAVPGPVYVSAVCILEIAIKEMLGKVRVPESPAEAAQRAGLIELPFRAEHAATLPAFPDLVRHDPFDRMLLTQAQAEGLDLLTSDRVLLDLELEWMWDACS